MWEKFGRNKKRERFLSSFGMTSVFLGRAAGQSGCAALTCRHLNQSSCHSEPGRYDGRGNSFFPTILLLGAGGTIGEEALF
jgi:hypothetical protein